MKGVLTFDRYSVASQNHDSPFREAPLISVLLCPPEASEKKKIMVLVERIIHQELWCTRCHLVLVSLCCISGHDPSFQSMNLMKTITILRRTAVIVVDRTKLSWNLNLEASKTHILPFESWKSVNLWLFCTLSRESLMNSVQFSYDAKWRESAYRELKNTSVYGGYNFMSPICYWGCTELYKPSSWTSQCNHVPKKKAVENIIVSEKSVHHLSCILIVN